MSLPDGLLFVIVACVAGAIVWALAWLRRMAIVGAAYKAKVLATLIFGAERSFDAKWVDDVSADSYWPMRLCRTRVDRTTRAVTVSFLGIRPRRTAVSRAGLGATLLGPRMRPSDLVSEIPESPTHAAQAAEKRRRAIPWPTGESNPALARAVATAFEEPDARRLRRTRAVVVLQDGRIVAERYASGFSAATPFPGWSMTKSVMGALIGVLVKEGRLSLPDRGCLPEWRDKEGLDSITLEDLLRMRSGLRFSEVYSDFTSDVIRMLFMSPDTAAYAAARPLTATPGAVWSYASGTTNILSKIARRVVGEADYVRWPRRALFDPIGMDSAVMEPDASGTFVASSFMLATARDWARFGQLYLQDGRWDGRHVLPKGWVDFSTSPTPQAPRGCYGAHWWLRLQPEMGGDTPAAARIPSDAYFAVGHEGQTLTVVPSRGLVIVRLGLSIYIDAWNQAGFMSDVLDAM